VGRQPPTEEPGGGRNTPDAIRDGRGHPNMNRRCLGQPQVHRGCSHHTQSTLGVVWPPTSPTVTWVAKHPQQFNIFYFYFFKGLQG
jgi:hypothetical protein